MLKGNLSSRPFYNEGVVNLLIALAVVAGVALTVFNASRLTSLWAERSRRAEHRAQAESQAAQVRAAAEAQERAIDGNALQLLAGATTEANALIDERTFSWTLFFDLVEKTMPYDARLVAVAPRVERGVFKIQMIVNAKTTEDLSQFLDRMLETGSFYDVLPTEQQRNEQDGSYSATMIASYLAPTPAPVKTAAVTGGRP
jgi:hypothetical protein